MSSDEPLKTSKSRSLLSSQVLLTCPEEEKSRQRYESDTIDSTSTDTVVRRTTAWRWVIVFGSFCAHFVADGVLFSFGILMHTIKEDLNIELHTVGIIASLFISLPLFLAPLSSALVNKIGCRCTTMLGGFLCSIGLLIASLLGNFTGALIGIGVFCGTGLSCVYVPAVVIVAHYFDENRAIATAIAVGGTGLGNAIVAQLIHVLNNYYSDWRETTLFLSGILFTIVGFGALFRPVEFSFERREKTYHHRMNGSQLPSSCMTSVEKLQRFIRDMDKQCASRQTYQSVSTTASNHEANGFDRYDSYSADDIKELEDQFNEHNHLNISQEKVPISRFQYLLRRQTINDRSGEETNPSKDRLLRFYSLPPEQQEKQLLQIYCQPISQKDIFYPGNVPLKSSVLSPTSCPNLIQSYVFEESATTISGDNTEIIPHHHRRMIFYRKGLSFLHTLRRMLGLHLFRDYRYVIFFISQFIFYLFYDLIYLFPVDYGEKVMGYTKKEMTMLITVLGFGQFFGQIFFGLLANYTCISDLILYDIGAILCGVAGFLIPFVVHSYVGLMMAILLFGLSVSANYALTSVILADMCGLDLLTSAYGLILLGQGISSLSGPVLGGWIAERYGYKSSLIIAGVFMGVSGLVTLLIPLIQQFKNKKADAQKQQTNTTTIRSDSIE